MFARLFLLVIGLALACDSFSQNNKISSAKVEAIARSFGDSIIIRWAPTTPISWKLGHKNGYYIERYTLPVDGKADKNYRPEKILLSREPLKPFPLPQWERLAKSNQYGAIAAQSIYGKEFKVNSKDDLMSMVSLAQEQEMRYSFGLFAADQSLKVAEASGLLFTDKSVKKGEKYVYKIFTASTSQYNIDTGYVFIGTNDNFPLPKPVELKGEFSDRTVMLSWNKVYYDKIFTTYIIERSDNGGISFKKVSDLPIVNISPSEKKSPDRMYIVDSLPENDKRYVYRIKGVTPFEELSPASDTIQGSGRANVGTLAPHIIKTENIKDGSIKINWRFSDKFNAKIEYFEILRSDKANGVYQSLNKVKPVDRTFSDKSPLRVNYYVVKAVEKSGHYISSFPAISQQVDSIPPMEPDGLTGIADKSGIVKLRWSKGKDKDLLGYKVYRANGSDEEFTLVSVYTVKDTVFTDSINIHTLTKKVYYKIMALDLSFNISPLSKAFELKRPDIIPPVPPRFDNYTASDTGIYLRWVPSTSNDVIKHILYRRTKGVIQWDSVSVFTTRNDYTDRKLKTGVNYEYVICALDDSGLESDKKDIVTLALVDYGFRPEITNIKNKVDRLKKEILLTWEYKEPKVESFQIYRAKGDQPLRLYKTLSGDQRKFIDKEIGMNTQYKYRIKAKFFDGGSSGYTSEIKIDY